MSNPHQQAGLIPNPPGKVAKFQHGPHIKWVDVHTDRGHRCVPVSTVEGRGEEYEVSEFTINEWADVESPWNVEWVDREDSPFDTQSESGGDHG